MPIFSEIQHENELIEQINYYYYLKPMVVINVRHLQIPLPHPLTELTAANQKYLFRIRATHGLLHVFSAMELINKIEEVYLKYVDGYSAALDEIAGMFSISQDGLLDLVRIAVLFHDSARKGDGMDLWDPQSADNCSNYLAQMRLRADLIELIADTIRYKDEPAEFLRKHQKIHLKVDFLRQLVNMADTLEVIRTRDVFDPHYLPIAHLVNEKIMVQQIIPKLVVPHRQLIIEQGRLAKKGMIDYQGDEYQFDDSDYLPPSGIDLALMAAAYLEKAQHYHLSILEVNQRNLANIIQKAIRGINTYLNEHKHFGIQFFHDGYFSPRYHGALGVRRARYYKSILDGVQYADAEKIKALCALFTSKEGQTLKEAVCRSFNQANEETLRTQFYEWIQPKNNEQNAKNRIDQEIDKYIRRANGFH